MFHHSLTSPVTSEPDSGSGEKHETQRGRTLLELTSGSGGQWTATQHTVDIEGTGETAALAAMDYCRKIARGNHEPEE